MTSAGLVKTRDAAGVFAPAQFKDLDDADKLSQPAYVPQDSGIELSAAGNRVRDRHRDRARSSATT